MTEYYTMWVHQIKTPIAAMRLTLQGMDTAEARELSEELQRIEQYVEMVPSPSRYIRTVPERVYFSAFEMTCSITNSSHFSSVSTE